MKLQRLQNIYDEIDNRQPDPKVRKLVSYSLLSMYLKILDDIWNNKFSKLYYKSPKVKDFPIKKKLLAELGVAFDNYVNDMLSENQTQSSTNAIVDIQDIILGMNIKDTTEIKKVFFTLENRHLNLSGLHYNNGVLTPLKSKNSGLNLHNLYIKIGNKIPRDTLAYFSDRIAKIDKEISR